MSDRARSVLRIALLALLFLALGPGAALGAGEDEGDKDKDKDKSKNKGKLELDVRYRFETVDEDGFAEDAEASTIRTRLGYTSRTYRQFYGKVEMEDVSDIGDDDYNSTANGKVQFPVVADPDDTELNQAFVGWKGEHHGLEARLGRQRIQLDNLRFIANVGWRQNEQTYDGLSFAAKPLPKLELYAAHLSQVNKIFGAHHPNPLFARQDLNAWVLEGDWQTPPGKVGLFGHWLEFEDVPASSHRNVGVRFHGKRKLRGDEGPSLRYRIVFADQTDFADGDAAIDVGYVHGEIGVDFAPVGVLLGYELLEGNGSYGFSTPLATLHAWNGWVDRFLNTPPDGLRDVYLVLSASPGAWKVAGNYHIYDADVGGADYGKEVGLVASRPFCKTFSFTLKAADYSTDGFGADVRKIWVVVGWKP